MLNCRLLLKVVGMATLTLRVFALSELKLISTYVHTYWKVMSRSTCYYSGNQTFSQKILRIGKAEKWHFCYWLLGFSKKMFFSMKITKAFIWASVYFWTVDGSFRILKDFIWTNMHTTVLYKYETQRQWVFWCKKAKHSPNLSFNLFSLKSK